MPPDQGEKSVLRSGPQSSAEPLRNLLCSKLSANRLSSTRPANLPTSSKAGVSQSLKTPCASHAVDSRRRRRCMLNLWKPKALSALLETSVTNKRMYGSPNVANPACLYILSESLNGISSWNSASTSRLIRKELRYVSYSAT